MLQWRRFSRGLCKFGKGCRSWSNQPNTVKALRYAYPLADTLSDNLRAASSPDYIRQRNDHTKVYHNAAVLTLNALKSKDPDALQSAWSTLKSTELISSPRHPMLRQYSNTIATLFSEPHVSELSPQLVAVLQEIAIHAAAFHSTNGLTACLRWLLRQRDARSILDLYDRFMQSLGDNEKWDWEYNSNVENADGEEESFVCLPLPNPTSVPEMAGRVHILLSAIVAHVIQDTFHSAATMCQNTSTWFSPSFSIPFLNALHFDQRLRNKATEFVSRLHILHLLCHPPELQRALASHIKLGRHERIEQLYQQFIDAIRGSDPYVAVRASSDPRIITTVSQDVWARFLHAFMTLNRSDLASKLWADTNELGVEHGTSLWNEAMEGYNRANRPRDTIVVWNMMHSAGVTPDARAFRAVIGAHFLCTRRHEAFELCQLFFKKHSAAAGPAETLQVCNAFLRSSLAARQFQQVDQLLTLMRTEGPSPDVATYNTLLGYFGRKRDFPAVSRIISEMDADGVVWDVYTFSAMLSALLKAGREDAPLLIVNMMAQQKVRPTTATFSAIIGHQLGKRQEVNLQAARTLLNLMEEDPSIAPNDVTYTAFLSGIFRGNWLTVDATEALKDDIMKRMHQRRVAPTTLTFHVLFRGYLDPRFPDGADQVWKYYCEMKSKRVPIFVQTWAILLHGMVALKRWDLGGKMVDDMIARSHYVSPYVANAMEKIRAKRSRLEKDLEQLVGGASSGSM